MIFNWANKYLLRKININLVNPLDIDFNPLDLFLLPIALLLVKLQKLLGEL